MENLALQPHQIPQHRPEGPMESALTQCIDWYSKGEGKNVEVNGVVVTVRLVGRKGRRARIAITAPPSATFRDAR